LCRSKADPGLTLGSFGLAMWIIVLAMRIIGTPMRISSRLIGLHLLYRDIRRERCQHRDDRPAQHQIEPWPCRGTGTPIAGRIQPKGFERPRQRYRRKKDIGAFSPDARDQKEHDLQNTQEDQHLSRSAIAVLFRKKT